MSPVIGMMFAIGLMVVGLRVAEAQRGARFALQEPPPDSYRGVPGLLRLSPGSRASQTPERTLPLMQIASFLRDTKTLYPHIEEYILSEQVSTPTQ